MTNLPRAYFWMVSACLASRSSSTCDRPSLSARACTQAARPGTDDRDLEAFHSRGNCSVPGRSQRERPTEPASRHPAPPSAGSARPRPRPDTSRPSPPRPGRPRRRRSRRHPASPGPACPWPWSSARPPCSRYSPLVLPGPGRRAAPARCARRRNRAERTRRWPGAPSPAGRGGGLPLLARSSGSPNGRCACLVSFLASGGETTPATIRMTRLASLKPDDRPQALAARPARRALIGRWQAWQSNSTGSGKMPAWLRLGSRTAPRIRDSAMPWPMAQVAPRQHVSVGAVVVVDIEVGRLDLGEGVELERQPGWPAPMMRWSTNLLSSPKWHDRHKRARSFGSAVGTGRRRRCGRGRWRRR